MPAKDSHDELGGHSGLEGAVRTLLEEFGVARDSEVYRNTPHRVARMYEEILSGEDGKNEPRITLFKNPGYRDILIVRKMPFYSLCEHHLLPMFGNVSIAYIPGEKILGLSKFPRIVKFFSSRLQVQERLTKDIADYLFDRLSPQGVFVLISARHMCMEMRGARSTGSETVSSAIRGVFDSNPATKEEALNLILEKDV